MGVIGRGGGDLQRLLDGISLVFSETLRRTSSSSSSVISSMLKTVMLSATDLVGITGGRIIPFPHTRHHTNNNNNNYDKDGDHSSSVIYFSDHDDDSNDDVITGVALEEGHHPQQQQQLEQQQQQHQKQQQQQQQQQQEQQQQDCHEEEKHANFSSNTPVIHIRSSHDSSHNHTTTNITTAIKHRRPRERRVPSTSFGRALGFAGLGAGLAWGTLQESAKRVLYGNSQSTGKQSPLSPLLSDQNAERLALALCRMRGAALKLGQMLSIQDESLVPAPVLAALDIVRQGADYMPRSQLNDVLYSELGPDWQKRLKSFNYEPLAAASIGQVHRAVMRDGLEVAMKIQYPGVADSIDSDIENVRRLLDYTNLIPKGLYLDRAIKVAKEELSRECDYELESRNQKRFRDLMSEMEGVYVPLVIDEVSSKRVLTTELVSGVPVDKVAALSQEVRNHVGRKLLELTLKELFVFQFMQTDPNWSNFLYDESTNTINLIDFGAAREYRKGFVDDYLRMVLACADRDRDSIVEMSTRLGFLTGMESDVMLDAHVQASFIVGLPFSTSGAYDFRASNITSSIADLGATMLKHRLTPPPDEAYSLHRKLSGAFLACIKLGVVAPCRDLLLQVHQQYRFSDENEETSAQSVA